MLAVSMAVEEAVVGLRRRERDVERPCVRVEMCMRAGARRGGYALHVMVVLMLFMASWREAHVFRWADHNRLVGVCDNMGVFGRDSRGMRVRLRRGCVGEGESQSNNKVRVPETAISCARG